MAMFPMLAFAQEPQIKVEFEDERVRVERVVLPTGAMLRRDPRDATVVALTPCQVIVYYGINDSGMVTARTRYFEVGEVWTFMGGRHSIRANNSEETPSATRNCELLITYIKTPSLTSKKTAPPVTPDVATTTPLPAPPVTREIPDKTAVAPAVTPLSPAPEPARGDYRFLSLNNTSIAYIEKGSGDPVIFVHGSLNDYRDWSASVDELSRYFRAISYSRRYHYPNPTKDKPKDYTFEQNVADLLALMDQLGIARANLVGQGYGAAIATRTAAAHPERVRSLVLLDPDFEQMLDSKRAYAAKYARLEIYSIVHKALSKDSPERAVQTYLDWLRGSGSYTSLAIEDQARLKQNANALKAQAFAKEDNSFACADAKKLKLPVLLLTGQPATPNKVMMMATLADCLPQAEQMIVPGQTKSLKVSDPAFVHRTIADFISRK